MNLRLFSPSSLARRTHHQILSLTLGLCCLTVSIPLFAVLPAAAQERIIRTITVTGRGVETIPTTLSQVALGVEIQGKTANEVQEEVARRSNAVVALLRSRNVEKLQTTGIRLQPVYSYENNVQRLTGYLAANIVSFRIDTKQAGSLLDDAVKAGATQINGVSFIATDEAIAAAQKQALRAAANDAQEQADTVLGALKLTKREIIQIQVNSASAPMPIQFASDITLTKVSAAPTPVIGGEQQIEATVTLQISY